jgi:hypothetical protein
MSVSMMARNCITTREAERLATNTSTCHNSPLHSMSLRISKRLGAVARIALAVALAAAFICAAMPLASVSAGNTCRLECCAARAPHAAGSCMNGSCHAAIQVHKSKLRRSKAYAPAEEFCGLRNIYKQMGYHAISTDAATTQPSVATLQPPCDADCGSCAVGSVSAKGKTAIATAYQLEPLWTRSSIGADHTSSTQTVHRRYSPRGPPTNLN